jgi:hypothetical protein
MNATQASPAPATPTDAPVPVGKNPRAKPRRFRLFDDGAGDFRIYEVIQSGHKTFPAGSLVAVPEFGGYESAIAAKKALRKDGTKLQGKTLLVLRGIEIVRIVVDTNPRVMIESKERKQVSGPVKDAEPAAPVAEASTN